ncbi:MAG: hypothetical protein ACK4NQ_04165 [Fimbriimonadaceae bacterium]
MTPGASTNLNTPLLARLFTPLALSWVFMALEQPALNRILNGLPDFELAKAALYLVMALALFFESPVIDLLSTSTALSRNSANVVRLRQFCLLTMGVTIVLNGLVGFTPLFDIIATQWLSQPAAVVEASRAPFQIMLFWAAFIGWRRCHHGFMIRSGLTRAIGVGTVLRIVVLFAVGVGGAYGLGLPGLHAVAWALLISVVAETGFTHWAARPAVAQLMRQEPTGPALSFGEIARFHVPQTATTLVIMLSAPAISMALGRSADPVANQSAWTLAFNLIWLMRAATYALPELVIAHGDRAEDAPVLWRFCLLVGSSLSLGLAILSVPPLGHAVLQGILKSSPEESARALPVILMAMLLPLLNGVMSYYRGMLTRVGRTMSRLYAIFAGVSSMLVFLITSIWLRWPGLVGASVAILAGQISEAAVLAWAWHRAERGPSRPRVTAAG